MNEQFVKIPNLPDGSVTLAAAGDYPDIIKALNKEGICTVSFEGKPLPEETARHTDMLICHTGGQYIFAEPSIATNELEKAGFIIRKSAPIQSEYPFDVKLNIAVGKSFFICNPKTADSLLLDELTLSQKQQIVTKQGYSKCSVCFVTENAVITEDISVFRALQKTQTDVLLISKGDIFLSDTHEGFFGGSSGKIDKNTLAVTGELRYHRDCDIILRFCEKHSVQIKELTKGRITDIGGIIPLKQLV